MMSKQKSFFTLLLVLGLVNSPHLYAQDESIEEQISIFNKPQINSYGIGQGLSVSAPNDSMGLQNGSFGSLYKLDAKTFLGGKSDFMSGPMSVVPKKALVECVNSQDETSCIDENSYLMFGKKQLDSMSIMSTISCNTFDDYVDFNGVTLNEESCEKELACITGGVSSFNRTCQPDKNQLDRLVNNTRYNGIITHGVLRNLVLGKDTKEIELNARIAKEVWGLETPKSCTESLDAKINECSSYELSLLAGSFKEFSNKLITDLATDKEKQNIENDSELNLKSPKTGDNLISSVKRMRHLLYQDMVSSSSSVDEVKKFQADLLEMLKTSPKMTVSELKVKMLKDYDNSSNTIISYLMDKNTSNFEFVIQTFDKQNGRQKLKEATIDNNPLAAILKRTIGENLRNKCINSNRYSLKMACNILSTTRPAGFASIRPARFSEAIHDSFFEKNSLKFLSQGERAVFVVKACENIERLGNCEYSVTEFGKQTRAGAKCFQENINRNPYDSDNPKNTPNDLASEFRGSGLVDDLAFESKSQSTLDKLEVSDVQKTEEDSNWTGHIADAFSGANGVIGGAQFAQSNRNNVTDLSSQKKNENNNDEVNISDSEKDKLRRAEEAQKIQTANSSAGFDSLRQELEALRTQMSIKQASDSLRSQSGNQSSNGQVIKDDAETEALKKKISDLEAKLTSAPAKRVERDYEDSGAWLRSPASSRNSGSGESKTQAQSNSRPAQEGGSANNSGSSANAPVPGANRNQTGTQAGAAGSGAGSGGLSLVRYENQSMVVLPQNATTQDVEKKILELGGKPFFIENADGSFTQVITELDKDGKPALNNEGKPKFLIKKVASDKVTAVKSRGVASAKPQAKVRDLKEIDAATRKRELDELLKKTKK